MMYNFPIHIDFKPVLDALARLFSKTHVQIGPARHRVKRDGVIVDYSLLDKYSDGNPQVSIHAFYCPSRVIIRQLFRRCLGELRNESHYLDRRTRLVCGVCGKIYRPVDTEMLTESIAADLRRKGQL